MQTMKHEFSDIDIQIAKRWNALRSSIYSEENILSIYSDIKNELMVSGAMGRDEEQWGLLHEGEDNWENLERFIKERLIFLDEYYAKFEQ